MAKCWKGLVEIRIRILQIYRMEEVEDDI